MARRTPRSRDAAPTRQPRAKSKKPAVSDVEVIEENSGEGLDTAVILATTFALVVALGFTDALLGKFGGGILF